MAGLFVVWDTPAESVLSELYELKIPMTTVDWVFSGYRWPAAGRSSAS